METPQAATERMVDNQPQPTRGKPNMNEERKEALSRLRAGEPLSSRQLNLILRSPNGILALAQMGWFTPA
ncbi:MAG: hypothetical protein FJ167_15365 [Gammaproteobacteria bacterium]|nr:hypothetical protein [Gammaproteobacteria bacterium]